MNTLKKPRFNTLHTLILGLLGAFALINSGLAQAFELRPFEAVYKVKKSGLSLGKAHFNLHKLEDNRWEYTSNIKPSGMAALFSDDRIKESSIVAVRGNTITPLHYTYNRTGSDNEHATITFDWAHNSAKVQYNDQSFNYTLKGGEQDHYSLVLNLMRIGSLGLASQDMTIINNEVKQYTYTATGSERVKTPLQKFDAIKMVQTGQSSRSLHYWLSPELNFAPVKIEQHKKGKKNLEMTLKSFQFK